jgi:transmembrane protein
MLVVLRVLLTFMFWSSAVVKLMHFEDAIGEMKHFGLSPAGPVACAVIAVSLGGSLLVMFGGGYAALGAALLAGFTLLTIPVAHDFWNMSGEKAVMEKYVVWEHLTVVGALLFVGYDAWRRF